MDIKPDVQTIDMLFRTAPQQYKIPIYQRRYVWDFLNWKGLWRNIEDISKTNLDLFAGIIVTRPSTTLDDLEIYEVIDGQQRLTTFQIILCVIRDICQSRGVTHIAEDADRLLRNDKEDERVLEDARYKLLPKEGADREAFCGLVDTSQYLGEAHPIHRAYLYFKDKIEKYESVRIEDLFSKVFTLRVNVAQIDISQNDTSEEIFASLNATGRMLSEFDYLRNNLFLRAGPEGDHLYHTYWLDNFEKEREGSLDLDKFLRNFLKANLEPEDQTDKLKPFDVYQTQYRRELKPDSKYAHLSALGAEIKSEFVQLTTYAKSYRELNSDMENPDSEIGQFTQFCKERKFPSLDPFLLFVKHRFANELDKVCAILESYIVRRMLYYDNYVNTNQASYKFIELIFFEAIVAGGFTARWLAESLYYRGMWPEDDEINEAFRNAMSKDHDFIAYVFRRIRNWNEEEIELYGFPQDMQDQLVLLKEIEKNIAEIEGNEQALTTLRQSFNNLWETPQSFIQ